MTLAANPIDGVRIHYESEGDGPPLVLHPGLSSAILARRDYWYVDTLRDSYRLIGDADPLYSDARRAAELLHNATSVMLPGLDHFQAMGRGSVVLPHVTEFLRRMTRNEETGAS